MFGTYLHYAAAALVAVPLLMSAYFGVRLLLARGNHEILAGRIVLGGMGINLCVAAAMVVMMVSQNTWHFLVNLGSWVSIPDLHYHFVVKLQVDALSLTFVFLSLILCGTIARFALRYLHRESGFERFLFLFAMFVFGMMLTSMAGTIETLFAGWEVVGLSSAFLVAYFQEREMPAVNGVRVWSIYRIADAAFLIATIALHHMHGEGDFTAICGAGPWPGGTSTIVGRPAFAVGLLLLIAAAGKSALVPFSGWLPRAMEGPTPSSAIFYGALSVHLGAFLLLRVEPLIDQSPLLGGLIVAVGLVTSALAALATSVQSDIKSLLSYASLVQVGIIVAEIGLGMRIIPLLHLVGHAFLRTLQFLRAPTLLHDYHALENAIGGQLPRRPGFWARLVGPGGRLAFYRLGIERGHLDDLIDRFAVHPFVMLFRGCDRLERRLQQWLAGRPTPPARKPAAVTDSWESHL